MGLSEGMGIRDFREPERLCGALCGASIGEQQGFALAAPGICREVN